MMGDIKIIPIVKKERIPTNALDSVLWNIEKTNIHAVTSGIKKLSSGRTRPFFSSSWIDTRIPPNAQVLKEYCNQGSVITLYKSGDTSETFYHISPKEFSYSSERLRHIHRIRSDIRNREHLDQDIETMKDAREHIKRMTREFRGDDDLSEVLARYTAGFGVLELILTDVHVQDIFIDAPAEKNRVYVTVQADGHNFGRCQTNLILETSEIEAIVSRLMYDCGRQFSEAVPILETNMKEFGTRATVVGPPLSPEGIALAFRKHDAEPWTLNRFIANNMLSPLGAALLSFLIDGNSSILIAGARGAGKTSLLSALMFEFPKSRRILTIEDTKELPVKRMQEIGYKVQSLMVRSSVSQGSTDRELTADEALRVSLRMGESAIVLGEVRGGETRTLYEAMRTGTAGSSVLGTFHAGSPKAVYERVVHDLKIAPKSFAATDIVVTLGLLRPGGALTERRRVSLISEYDKSSDGCFFDLMRYESSKDALENNDILKESACLRRIAGSWGISMEQAVGNIDARRRMREEIVKSALESGKTALLNAHWTEKSNSVFWKLIGDGYGNDELFNKWKEWFGRASAYA